MSDISSAEWNRRAGLVRKGREAARMMDTGALTIHELGDYETLIGNAQELIHEQYLPEYAMSDTDEESKANIRQLFTLVACNELRRVLIRMSPADALMLADTVIRCGTQWNFKRDTWAEA